MKTLMRLFTLILIGLAVGATAHWGVIITKREFFVYTKDSLGFKGTVVDTRSWGVLDFAGNPKLSGILARRGYDNMIGQLKDSSINTPVKDLPKRSN